MTTGTPLTPLQLASRMVAVAMCFCLPLLRSGVTVMAMLLLLLWLAERGPRGIWRDVTTSGPGLAAVVFIALNVLSLLWSAHPADGLLYISKYRYLLLLPAIASVVDGPWRERALAAFLAGYGLALAWSYALVLGILRFGYGYPENPAPSMLHLDWSMFMAIATLLILDRVVRGEDGALRRAAWAAFALASLGGLFLNIGRSGQAAFAGGLLVALLLYLRARTPARAAAALALVAVLVSVAYLLVPVFHSRVDAAVSEVRGAIGGREFDTNQGKRIAAMIVARDIIVQHPVLGTGVGDLMPEFRRLLDERHPALRDAVYWFPHLHNQYLQVWGEIGLVGLAALVWLLASVARIRSDGELEPLAPVLAAVFLVGCVADPFLHKQLPLAMFASLAGLLAAGRAPAQPDPLADR